MITVSVQSNMNYALARLANFDSRQLPFVVANALTKTAMQAKDDLRQSMATSFDRPTPYTLNSLYVKPATKQTLEATVRLKDESYKGTPANKYLAPEVMGGSRNIKRVERLLSGRGILPSGMSIVPASGAELDNYGNPRRGQYSKILSQLGAQFDPTSNETAASRKRKRKIAQPQGRYFVAPVGNKQKLHPGIYARFGFKQGSAVKPVFMFVRTPSYRKRYPFFDVVERAIDKNFSANLDAAMALAIATSR